MRVMRSAVMFFSKWAHLTRLQTTVSEQYMDVAEQMKTGGGKRYRVKKIDRLKQ